MVQNTTFSEVNYPAKVPCLKRTWTYTTGNAVESSPAVVDGVVYAGSQVHSLYACDATTDEKLWSHTAGDSIISSPMGAQGFVYVGSNDHNLYAFNQIHISPRENSQNS